MAEFVSLVATQFHVAHFLPLDEILRSKNRAYLDLVPRGSSGGADAFREWFLKTARRFDGAADQSQTIPVRAFLTQFGHREKDAFRTAQTLAENDGVEYWEGYAYHAALAVPLVIHHAWNTAGGELVDVTWSRGKENRNAYLGVRRFSAVRAADAGGPGRGWAEVPCPGGLLFLGHARRDAAGNGRGSTPADCPVRDGLRQPRHCSLGSRNGPMVVFPHAPF